MPEEIQPEASKESNQHLGVMRVSMFLLKHVFLLPDDYEVVSAHVDSLHNEIHMLVGSPALPTTGEYQQLPDVEPLYQRVEINSSQHATIRVTDIKVHEYPPYNTREDRLASLL